VPHAISGSDIAPVPTLQAPKEQGFTAFKIAWEPFGREDNVLEEAIMATAREIVASESLLAVDTEESDSHWHPNLKWIQDTATMLKNYVIELFEEPLSPDDKHGLQVLTRSTPPAISGGEALARRHAFLPCL
jgi:L-alanine-DL-glutamate epimerase-like enolase superfamily enzyme